ncbi:MAG: cyclic nucleotide-binding domain-containing protein [Planctomycetota bacterium]|nr:cyclic nucleotide-binding domain-containing protein [Planctomycetota bacterium]
MPATPDDLHQRLARVPLFAAWAEDDRRRLAAHAAFLDAAPGETILREGEFGDRMFLIERGSVQIFTRGFDGSDLVLARLEPGQWFGEQALLPGGSPRRNASARALDACRLVTLSRGDVAAALGRHPELLRRFQDAGAAERALREARIGEQLFAQLGVSSGSAAYELKTWPAGAVIFREGDPGDRAFLVLRGRAQASRREDGRDEVLSELLPGQFFGERAILQDAPARLPCRRWKRPRPSRSTGPGSARPASRAPACAR